MTIEWPSRALNQFPSCPAAVTGWQGLLNTPLLSSRCCPCSEEEGYTLKVSRLSKFICNQTQPKVWLHNFVELFFFPLFWLGCFDIWGTQWDPGVIAIMIVSVTIIRHVLWWCLWCPSRLKTTPRPRWCTNTEQGGGLCPKELPVRVICFYLTLLTSISDADR